VSWVTRSEEPAKLNVTVEPGFSVWKIVPICVNVAFSDAAANTVNVPAATGPDAAALDDPEVAAVELDAAAEELAAEEVVAALVVAALVVDALVVDDAVPSPELQPTTRVATHSPAKAATTLRKRVAGKHPEPRKCREPERLTRNLQEFR